MTEPFAAREIEKVLRSAVANAEANHGLFGDDLRVSAAYVDEGPTIKRWRARARGRVARIRKRTCHITIKLAPAREPRVPRTRSAEPPAEEPKQRRSPRRRAPAKPPEAEAAVAEPQVEEPTAEEPKAETEPRKRRTRSTKKKERES